MQGFAVSSLLCVGLMGVFAYGSMDNSMYEDYLMQNLYKRLSQLEDYYSPEELSLNQPDWSDIPLDSRDSSQAEIRDPEFLAHGSNGGDGFQYISGGAGEGKQHLTPEGTQDNIQEVKSDETLPYYCHPPNPCPKGHTEKDGCQEFIEDTADAQKNWISKMQDRGMCSCDEEHMFECPNGQGQSQNAIGGIESREALDDVIDNLLNAQGDGPYHVTGSKRLSIVQKKSPRIKRSVDNLEDQLEKFQAMKSKRNPYLEGGKIRTVAKKGKPSV